MATPSAAGSPSQNQSESKKNPSINQSINPSIHPSMNQRDKPRDKPREKERGIENGNSTSTRKCGIIIPELEKGCVTLFGLDCFDASDSTAVSSDINSVATPCANIQSHLVCSYRHINIPSHVMLIQMRIYTPDPGRNLCLEFLPWTWVTSEKVRSSLTGAAAAGVASEAVAAAAAAAVVAEVVAAAVVVGVVGGVVGGVVAAGSVAVALVVAGEAAVVTVGKEAPVVAPAAAADYWPWRATRACIGGPSGSYPP